MNFGTDNDTLVILLGFITSILTSIAVLLKNASGLRHQERMFRLQHDTDRLEREEKARDLERQTAREAEAVRLRLENSALGIQQRVNDATRETTRALTVQTAQIANVVAEATSTQTVQLAAAVDQAKLTVADKTDAALQEANHVNQKIETQNRAIEQIGQVVAHQGRILEDLLRIIERRRGGADPVVPENERRTVQGQEVIAIVAAEPTSKT